MELIQISRERYEKIMMEHRQMRTIKRNLFPLLNDSSLEDLQFEEVIDKLTVSINTSKKAFELVKYWREQYNSDCMEVYADAMRDLIDWLIEKEENI